MGLENRAVSQLPILIHESFLLRFIHYPHFRWNFHTLSNSLWAHLNRPPVSIIYLKVVSVRIIPMLGVPDPAVGFRAYLKMLSPGRRFPEILVPSPQHSTFSNHYSTLSWGQVLISFAFLLTAHFWEPQFPRLAIATLISPQNCVVLGGAVISDNGSDLACFPSANPSSPSGPPSSSGSLPCSFSFRI